MTTPWKNDDFSAKTVLKWKFRKVHKNIQKKNYKSIKMLRSCVPRLPAVLSKIGWYWSVCCSIYTGHWTCRLYLAPTAFPCLKFWADVLYAVHEGTKSHIGGVMSFRRGAIMCKSGIQKLNTKSSTESELVGASDYMPNTIWAKLFLGTQGYELTKNLFAQDNQSTILYEKNGRSSCGQKSCHIDIRFFFIKDRIQSEGITVVYCPTEGMLANFFTKPLQGSLFQKFCVPYSLVMSM